MRKKNQKVLARQNNRRAFTLVELLATIAIIGILSIIAVSAVSHYVQEAHREKNQQNVKTVTVAAELYLQGNRSLFPKQIGDDLRVPLKQLKESNYLKEDIKNDKGESCMINSFVRVLKLSAEDYSYMAFLYCGSDPVPDELPIPKPSVDNFMFSGGTVNDDGSFSDIKSAKFSFNINGGAQEDGTLVNLYSYQYAIFVGNQKGSTADEREIYNSGSVKSEKTNSVSIHSEKLSSYFDVAGYTSVRVEVIAYNEAGGRVDFTSSSVSVGEFQDQTKPTCGDITGEAENDDSWINKTSATKSRQITVGCQDNKDGSGCKRKKFSQTWPYGAFSPSNIDYKYGARWSYITISDNAKTPNTTDCYVRVNVDLQAPEVKVIVYKGGTNQKVLNMPGTVYTVSDDGGLGANMPSGTINYDKYVDLDDDNREWMNAERYPDGITIDIEVKDNIYLDEYTWRVSDPDSESEVVTQAEAVLEQDNGVAVSGSLTTGLTSSRVSSADDFNREEHGTLSATIRGLRLHREGKRHAEFTVCDKAGNCTTVDLYAHIDRTYPTCNRKIEYGTGSSWSEDGSPYFSDYDSSIHAKWLSLRDGHNTSIKEQAKITQWCTDYERSVNSGCNEAYSNKSKVYNDDVQAASATAAGASTRSYVKDNAGNKTECIGYPVYIDYVVPNCTMNVKDESGNNASNKWVNKKVTVSRTCDDDTKSLHSGCDSSSSSPLSYPYDTAVNTYYTTNQASAAGAGVSVKVTDKAGNYDTCSWETVKIDKDPPKCIVWSKEIKTYTTEDYYGDWTANSVKVYRKCEDGINESQCTSAYATERSHTFDPSIGSIIDTTKANAAGNTDGTKLKVYDNAGNEKECDNTTVKIDRKAPEGNCTIDGHYTKQSDQSFDIVYSVTNDEGKTGTPTVTYSLDGGSSYGSTHQQTLTCESPGNKKAYIKLKDSLGNESSAIQCNVYGSTRKYVEVPACCSDGHIKYKDGTTCYSSATKTCGTSSYNRLAYSSLFNDYSKACSSYDESYGGSSCNLGSCSTTVYHCREDSSHGTSYWYDSLGWIWIHTGTDTTTYYGTWVGYNTAGTISGTRTLPGTSTQVADLLSCGTVTVGGSTRNAYAGSCSGGWIYTRCYHSAPNAGYCTSECPH